MHSCVQRPCKFIGTKESVYIRKELNSQRIGLVHQHGHRVIVLEHQYGCHDVMCICSITASEVNRRGIQCTLYVFEYSVNFPERL